MFRHKEICHFIRVCLGVVFVMAAIAAPALAGAKTFIKEYAYQASEDDSRNSSRVIALREVKRLLLEELGTYLESETAVADFQLTREQITTLTAGIVQVEIIEDKWDGRVYWIKSKITADADQVLQSINALRKDREKTLALESIRRKSDALLLENERLRQELASAKNENRDTRKAAYDKSVKALSAADWLEKGYAAKNRGDFKAAIENYSRAIELDPDNAMAYFARALISDKTPAMRDFNTLLSMPATDSEAYLIRAWTYRELEKHDLAIEAFGKAIETAAGIKESASAYNDRGRYYFAVAMGDAAYYRHAVEDLSRAIELDPGDSEKFSTRGSAHVALNDVDLAFNDFSRAIALAPTYVHNYILRGICLINRDPARAIDDFTRAIAVDPKEYSTYMHRAQVYESIGQNELAIDDYSKMLALAPEHHYIYRSRARLYAKIGQPALALRDYGTHIKLAPDSQSAYMDRAMYYSESGRHSEAIADFDKAVKLRPDFEATVQRGFSYFKLGRRDPAIRDYNAAIALGYDWPSKAYYYRALLYAQESDLPKAIADLEQAIRRDPFYATAAQKEVLFDPLRSRPEFIRLVGK
ncbi:MAG: tetratricopeptide repeat protein [Pseudomonadota bacterium]